VISGVYRHHDSMDICQEQVNRGMAWFYREHAINLPVNTAARYDQAETLARQKNRGYGPTRRRFLRGISDAARLRKIQA
jgi:hypothetical protein